MKKSFHRRFNYEMFLWFFFIGLPLYFILDNRINFALLLVIEGLIFFVVFTLYVRRGKVVITEDTVSIGSRKVPCDRINDITLLEVDYSNFIAGLAVGFQTRRYLKIKHRKGSYGVEEETLILETYSNENGLIDSIKLFCEEKQVTFLLKKQKPFD